MLPVPTLPVYGQSYASPLNYTSTGYPMQSQLGLPLPQVRQSVYNRSEVVGQATFDPDPITSSYDSQPAPQRVTAIGPYGAGGQQTTLTGVYKPATIRTHVTSDLHEHPVNVIQAPMQQYTPPVTPYASITPPVAYEPYASQTYAPYTPYTPPIQYNEQYQRVIGGRSEPIGQPTFDPDPLTSAYVSQSPSQRVTAVGPYGSGGQQTTVTGVYRPPAVRTYVTSDIPQHTVNVL